MSHKDMLNPNHQSPEDNGTMPKPLVDFFSRGCPGLKSKINEWERENRKDSPTSR